MLAGQREQQIGDRAEDSQRIPRPGAARRAGADVPCRQQSCQLHALPVRQPRPGRVVGAAHGLLQGLDPAVQGKAACRLVEVAAQDVEGGGPSRQFLHQPGLADAGLAGDDGDAARGSRGATQEIVQTAQLGIASHEQPRGRRGRPRRRADAAVRAVGVQQRPVERLRGAVRLQAELTLERLGAQPVLANGGSATALARVELHDGAVQGLLERVDGQRAECRGDGGLDAVLAQLALQQPVQGREGDLPESLTLGEQPVLERASLRGEALQEVALVQRRRPLQGVAIPRRRKPLEDNGVDVDPVCLELHGLAVDPQGRLNPMVQRTAQRRQRVPQALAGLRLSAVPPE